MDRGKCKECQMFNDCTKVCAEEDCDGNVFRLAMTLLDRVVQQLRPSVRQTQLQLLGAVCLFIANKLRNCTDAVYLSASKLAEYSNHTFTKRQLLEWELVILLVLKWEVAVVTAGDFVDLILCQLSDITSQQRTPIRRHALMFLDISVFDFKFSMYAPSTVSAACVRLAVHGLFTGTWCATSQLDDQLCRLTHTDPEVLQTCHEQLKTSVHSHHIAAAQHTTDAAADADGDGDDEGSIANNGLRKRRIVINTPTDLREISLVN